MTELSLALALSSAGEDAVMAAAREPEARSEGGMMAKNTERAERAARELGDVPSQLAALEAMTVGDLAARYRELYGEPTRTRNKQYLKKRLRWRIEELHEGGLSARAIARITELGDGIPVRWRMRLAEREKLPMPEIVLDPRLPPVGSVLRRIYQNATHEVVVAIDGFDYAGQRYKTLSAIAKRITGTAWNGYLFFGIAKRPAAASATADAPAAESKGPEVRP